MVSRSREKTIIAAVIVIICAVALYAYFYVLDWREREVNRGYSLEAIANPFLAADLFLARHKIDSHYTLKFTLLDKLDASADEEKSPRYGDTLVLVDARGAISGERFDRLITWVEEGGTLITSLRNPFIGRLESEDELFQELEIYVAESEQEDDPLQRFEDMMEELQENVEKDQADGDIDAEEPALRFSDAGLCGEDFVEFDVPTQSHSLHVDLADQPHFYSERYDWDWRVLYPEYEDALLAAQFPVGSGRVVVMNDLSLWRNSRIQCHDHAHLLWSLVNKNGSVWFLQNFDAPSLMSLLLRYLPYAVVAAILLIVLTIWSALTRFGPVFQPQSLARRSLAEHIHASANFLWKHSRYSQLVNELRQAIERIMARRVMDFDKKSEAEKLEFLAGFTRLDAKDIQDAMYKKDIETHHEFVAFVKTLKTIKDNL